MTEPRCAGCGRRLKRPTPTGLGPVCARRLTGRPARIRITRDPDVPAGQTELPLQPMQPTLWSL
ncbi:hypothetical protein DV517_61820 [Streptomyces sp. S816]|uniref:hypothetical protein n=1 Tax=Streptomyces sp. S816 TaxID=2283197 RepID=UPI00109C58E9|nr:hypothetical protein [Streptomyces sp. S816]TGZ14699.1 hypothetical protein DV517_61820 [Streptomyces sp. S816]